ncbi:MAG: biotin/lipoyl-binding protein [Defluviitaleaceae bacterium]|nr:biotin/lipoyl-binding protein [Defluviitaleaceae bacterium]
MKSYIVRVNGVSYNVEVEEAAVGALPQPAFIPAPAPVRPTAAPAPAAAPAPKPVAVATGETPLTSPLPGTVLKILASRGQAVKKGDPVMVIEAMKMENEVAAPIDGTVASINVSVGSAVNSGDVLLTIS